MVAASARAAGWGIRPGMPMSQADALLWKNAPDPWVSPHDSQADFEALQQLADRCREHLSPWVGIEPLDQDLWAGQILHQPQSLLLDVTGIGTLLGSERALLEAAIGLLKDLHYEGRLAIADTVGTAWGVAHYQPPSDRVEGMSMPAWIIPSGAHVSALQSLRIAALRVPRNLPATLRRLGIDSIGDLLALPRESLVARFGPALLRRLDQALGRLPEPFIHEPGAPSIQETIELEYATADREILAHRLGMLVTAVAGQLQDRHQGALEITCRLQTTDNAFCYWRLGLFTPTADADHLHRLLAGTLERAQLGAPVQQLSLVVPLTGPLRVRQPMLIQIEDDASSGLEWSRLVDALSGRLGRGRVLGIHATDHPLPEEAFDFRPLTGQPLGTFVPGRPMREKPSRTTKGRRRQQQPQQRPSPEEHGKLAGRDLQAGSEESKEIFSRAFSAGFLAPPTPAMPLRRPLVLLRPPRLLSPLKPPPSKSLHKDPEKGDRGGDPPCEFRFAEGTDREAKAALAKLVRWWGPERLETAWWHGPMQRRDYFRAETDRGQWLWIYHDLRQDNWWLHGYFP